MYPFANQLLHHCCYIVTFRICMCIYIYVYIYIHIHVSISTLAKQSHTLSLIYYIVHIIILDEHPSESPQAAGHSYIVIPTC